VTTQHQYFRVEQLGEVTVITLTAFDFFDQMTNAEAKRELVAYVQTEKPSKLVVSFQHIQRFSSEFIGTLVSVKKQQRTLQADAQMRLCALQPSHREVFKLVDPHQALFKLHDTVVEASAAF